MSARRPQLSIWKVFAGISAISFLAIAATVILLYRTAHREQVRDLERAVDTLASLMESVAQFDQVFSANDDPHGPRGATMRQVARGLAGVARRRRSDELVIGQRDGKVLRVLRPTQGGTFAIAADLKYDGERARPLVEALAGRHGSGEFLDHRGVRVLAAHAPVPSLEIGLSYQMDMAGLRAPFVRAGLWAIGIYLLLAGLLTVGYWLLTRRLAARLAASTTHLSSVYELAPVLMLTMSAEGDLKQVNPCFEKVTGWRLDEIKGKEWLAAFVPEHDRGRIQELLSSVIDGASVHGSVNPLLTRAGEERLIEWHAQPLRDTDGCVTGLLAAGIDVTERQQQEGKLRLSESALATSLSGIAMASLDGKIFYVNAAWLEMHGYEADEAAVLGTTPIDHVENPAEARDIIAALMVDGQWSGELACRRRDGSIFPAELACNLVTNSAGQSIAMLASFRDITERKQAERELGRSEARYRHLHESMRDAFVQVDMAGSLVEWNRAYEVMLGYAPDELRRLTYVDITPERWHAVEAGIVREQILPRGYSEVYEKEYRRRDGTVFPVELRTFLLRDDLGEPAGMWAIVRDISERKRSEAALRASEARVQLAVSSGGVGLWEWDIATNQLEWNDQLKGIFGLPRETTGLTIATFVDAIFPEDRPETERLFRGALERRTEFTHEYRVVWPDGTVRWIWAIGHGSYDTAGQPRKMTGAALDTTDRRRAEVAVRESEARLNEAQRIAKVGSWELNHASGVLHWSDEIFRIFEIDPAEFGASYEAFLHSVHPEDREAVDTAFTASLRDRQPYRIVHRLLMADGRIKHVEEQCETDFTPDGRPVESRGTVQDVTERLIADDKIRRSLREKETLLREVHHRVKNNLQVVSSMLFLDQRQAESPAVVAQFQRSRDRVAAISLVHESLYQAPDFGGINFSEYVGSLGNQILREFSSRAGPVALQVEGGGFTLGINEAVPCALIVNELLTNSLKHAFPHGRGGAITIRLETATDGTRHLWFGDSGVGIADEAIPRRDLSLGMKLVDRLTEQLQATFAREPAAEGIFYHLAIPAPAAHGTRPPDTATWNRDVVIAD